MPSHLPKIKPPTKNIGEPNPKRRTQIIVAKKNNKLDKNILLLVHAVVVSLIMYFGSLYIFNPVQKVLLEGIENNKK